MTLSTKNATQGLHVDLLFPNEWIRAADLRGQDVALTISSVSQERLKTTQGESLAVVVEFAEMDKRPTSERKRFVCNKTNAKTSAKLYGTDVVDWVDRRVTLFPTRCEAFGEMVDCIRIRPEVPA